MRQGTNVARMLADGARRSLEAQGLAAPPARREPLTPALLWRRYKWPLIGAGLFLILELLTLGGGISGARGHF
jgi:hypothetical protein